VAKEIGPIAKPKDIRFGENLPLRFWCRGVACNAPTNRPAAYPC